jgi:hypothetical protein
MGLGSGIRDSGSGIRKKPVLDPGSRGQKGTGSRSATLTTIIKHNFVPLPRASQVIRLYHLRYNKFCTVTAAHAGYPPLPLLLNNSVLLPRASQVIRLYHLCYK